MAAEREIERMVVRLVGDASSYTRMFRTAVRTASNAARSIGRSMRAIGRSMTLGVTAPIAGLGALATREFAKFDQAMTESTSIMQVTEEQTRRLRQTAIDLSGRAAQAPEELARSYFFLASAGKDAEQSMSLLEPVTKFATAGAFDMALATDLLTDAQSALGLSSKDVAEDQRNLIRLSDALVKSNTLANATVQQFSESLTNTAGASLKAFNKDVEEGLAILAAYADQGVKGAVAGTSLSRVMLLLSKGTRDAAKEHARLGFRVFDASGKMRNFADIIQNLEDITRGMSDETKAATLEQLGFQARIQQAILPLLGTSKAIRRYEGELRSAAGTTERVAGKQMLSFTNQMKVLRNQLSVVAIEIGQELAPLLVKLSEFVQQGVQAWRELHPNVRRFVVFAGLAAAAVGPLLLALGGIVGVIGFAITGFSAIMGVIGALLSPVAILIGLVTALGAVIVTRTGAAGAIVQWFGRQWQNLLTIIGPVFKQVVALFKTGEIELAVRVLWVNIKLAWLTGTQELARIWKDFQSFYIDTVDFLAEAMLELRAVFDKTFDLEKAKEALRDMNRQSNARILANFENRFKGINEEMRNLNREIAMNQLSKFTNRVKEGIANILKGPAEGEGLNKLKDALTDVQSQANITIRTGLAGGIGSVEAVATGSVEALQRIGEARFAAAQRRIDTPNKAETRQQEIVNLLRRVAEATENTAEKPEIELEPAGLGA